MNTTENKTAYYYTNGERVPLVREPSVYAVRFKPGNNARSKNISKNGFQVLGEDSQPLDYIANYGLQIFQADVNRVSALRSLDEQKAETASAIKKLNEEDGVEYAAIAYHRSANPESTDKTELMFVNRRFVVQFKPDVSKAQIDELNAQYGVTIIEALDYAENGFLLEAPDGEGERGPVALANIYYETTLTEWSHPNFIRRIHYRHMAVAPSVTNNQQQIAARRNGDSATFLSQQWHLNTAKVIDAWNITRGSGDITIAILDDGIDIGHPEFAGKIVGQFDFGSNTADGSPKLASDSHGTACAGVAVARGVKAFGVAPNVKLLAIRTPRFLGGAEEAKMFKWASDQGADIMSCSWGPKDNTGQTDPLPDSTRTAIRHCVTKGRNGKGIPIFWAAGNGGESVSTDGYASNPDVMAIAASTDAEETALYSDFGPEIWVAAPSNGGTRSIFTVDRRGNAGYNPDPRDGSLHPASDLNYTSDFGGTSSATPLVAGVAGLMLSVRPDLSLADVREILKDTADEIGDSEDYDSNGHSEDFGYGRVNALRAVQKAQQHGGGSPASGTPSINGPDRISPSDGPPTFHITLGGRRMYAVEVATRANLFNFDDHGNERNETNFYGSWEDTNLLTTSPYTLPASVWNRMKQANQLFYRVHVADDGSWTNHASSTPGEDAASAPHIRIEASTTVPTPGSGPSIQGPASMPQNGTPPRFTVNRGGRKFYAVEVATRANLFNFDDHGNERNETNFYGSWEDTSLLSTLHYDLPMAVWQRLNHGSQLFYRVHVADDGSWTNHAVTVPGEQTHTAPSIQITGGTSPIPDGGTKPRTITFPSGATFNIVDDPQDNVDYRDLIGHGVVPLIEVRGRGEEKLSRNFQVKELAASDGARYARISPELVEGLQQLRDALGSAITVTSGYRHPALNQSKGGVETSQHIAGRAASIRSSKATPHALSVMALETLGCKIGLGLGSNSLHIDFRGRLTSFILDDDASMSEAEFDDAVRETCADLGR